MYKPTDEEINRLCAEVCGWTDIVSYQNAFDRPGRRGIKQGTKMGVPPGEIYCHRKRLPDYCNDLNALPELIDAVCLSIGNWTNFAAELPVYDCSGDEREIAYETIRLHPRTVCIAALKALGHWPDDEWDTEP